MSIVGLHHFSIACSDADRSVAFYRDRFGMEVVSEREVPSGGFVEEITGTPGAHVRIVHMSGYGSNFELLEYIAPRGDRRARHLNNAGAAHLCFITDDLDAFSAELKAAGVTIRSMGADPITTVGGPNAGGKGLYVEDPDGNAVEIIQLARPWPGAGNEQDTDT
ncbi:MAG: VOC family protein [Gaiellaceae bacterium]